SSPGANDSTVSSTIICTMRPVIAPSPPGRSWPRSGSWLLAWAKAAPAIRATTGRASPAARNGRLRNFMTGHPSLHDQRLDQQLAHATVGAHAGPLVEILAQVLQTARPLDLGQRQRLHIGHPVLADL